LCALGSASAVFAQAQPPQSQLEEVVVTATRQSETLSRVPISVSVLTQQQMEAQGVKEFRDVVRLTPSLSFNSGFGGGNDISIRGVSSKAGAATTGIYIDDTPIHVRQVAYAAGTVFPVIFDLERIEVLRGPQGTLFGSGSQGGTIRFLQPSPSLTNASGHARVEGSLTRKSGGSYEAGVAYGGPIVEDRIGFRVSAYYRHEGGFIDRVPGAFALVDPTGAAFDRSMTFTPTGEGDKNANSQNSLALRGALKFQVTEALEVTPSVFYQKQKLDDEASSFWLSASDRKGARFVTPMFTAGPVTPGGLTELRLPQNQSAETQLFLPSLGVQYDFGAVMLYSTTSYLKQEKVYYNDQTMYYAVQALGTTPFPVPGAKAQNIYDDTQKLFSQEVRLQSTDSGARLKWVAGAFYSRSKQFSYQFTENNIWASSSSFYGFPIPANGSPFGPGSTSFQNTFGAPFINGSGTYLADATVIDTQLAGFGQADFRLTERLTAIAGVRVARTSIKYSLVSDGAENNLNLPFGAECPTGPVCPFGSGVFAPMFPGGVVKNSETSVTPKVGLNFQATPDDLFYVTAAKGFRPGGAQIQLPASCNQDLIDFGYVEGGVPQSPPTYESDTVWSYEAGAKNRLFGNRLSIASSAYLIRWKNIQTNLQLPICGYAFVDNLGSATITGFDVNIEARPLPQLTLNLAAGYTHTSLDDGLYQPTGDAIYPNGSPILNAGPPLTVTLSAQYEFAPDSELQPYLRADYTYTSRLERVARTDPKAFNYDPLLPVQDDTHLVNMRLGASVREVDVSLFVNNLLDSAPLLQITRGTATPYLYTASTFRPRTIGITASRRF
jgi:outer membrane receptor protein involved in Fe transport